MELGVQVRTKSDRQSRRDGTEEREEPFSMMKGSVLYPIEWFTFYYLGGDAGVVSLVGKT